MAHFMVVLVFIFCCFPFFSFLFGWSDLGLMLSKRFDCSMIMEMQRYITTESDRPKLTVIRKNRHSKRLKAWTDRKGSRCGNAVLIGLALSTCHRPKPTPYPPLIYIMYFNWYLFPTWSTKTWVWCSDLLQLHPSHLMVWLGLNTGSLLGKDLFESLGGESFEKKKGLSGKNEGPWEVYFSS